MASSKSIWYHIGHAYERARLSGPTGSDSAGGAVTPLRERRPARPEPAPTDLPWPDADDILAGAAWLVLDRVIGQGRDARRPGVTRLAWAAIAGASSAFLVDLLRPLLVEGGELTTLDAETTDRLIAGAGQGLVYGALVEPRVPGPALFKGALYGSVEFVTDQMGGLSKLLSSHTPQGRLPVVGDVLAGRDAHDRAFLEHFVFGLTLALLYESNASRNGTLPDRDAD
jgi:hypothetical protein